MVMMCGVEAVQTCRRDRATLRFTDRGNPQHNCTYSAALAGRLFMLEPKALS